MSIDNTEVDSVLLTVDGVKWYVPFASDNRYYQEYLKWVAEGNEPLPADE